MKKNVFLLFLITSFLIGCTTEVDVHESARKDTTPPEAITNLSAKSDNKSITLSWNNPNDEDFSGTSITFTPKVNSITQPVIVEGIPSKTSTKSFSGLRNNVEYTFTLVALDKNENGSEPASIKATPADTTPPAEVRNLTATVNEDSIKLEWLNPSDEDFAQIEISFTPKIDDISQPILLSGKKNNSMDYSILGLQNETEYSFTLKSLDNNSNKSAGKIIKATFNNKTPPHEISNFNLIRQHKRITLNWTNPTDVDFYGVEISSYPAAGTLSQPVFIQCKPSENKELIVQNLENEVEYEFIIKTIDTYNNKSEGLQKKATPEESTIFINITLPNDNNENITLTNDKAPINVFISSNDDITKAVWKKRSDEINIEPNLLINDNDATSFSITTDSPETVLYATENGIYDIVAQNSEGIIAYNEIEIRTIDKNPLPAVTNLSVSCDGTNINIDWTNPTPQNTYDASIQNIIISCTYNQDCSDTDNTSITLNDASIQNYSLKIPDSKTLDDYVRIYVNTIDTAGNKSEITYSEETNCGLVIVIDGAICGLYCSNDIKKIKNNAKIIVRSFIPQDLFESISSLNTSLRIDLDLSSLNYSGYDNLLSKSFSSVNQSNSVKNFNKCSQLKSIILPKGLDSIGYEEFAGLVNLSTIVFPNTVTEIRGFAFCGCKNLSNIVFAEDVTKIDKYTFSDCNNLSTVIIPEEITKIGEHAFEGCKNISSIVIPKTVTEIGEYAFSECKNLSSIVIPEGVTKIGSSAFEDCTQLSNIILPKTVTKIEKYTFRNCKNLSSIVIPEGVTEIEDNAFKGCENLTTIVIPEGVTKIGSSAFEDCTQLSNIILPKTVTKIEKYTFRNCKNLSSIVIPEGVTEIEDEAFVFCSKLSTITIPKNMQTISSSAFVGMIYTIKEIYYTGTLGDWCTKEFKISNISSSYDLYINNEIIKNANIPEEITKISDYAFCNCKSLTTITIPEGVTEIGVCAFNCSNLSSIVIPNSLTHLYSNQFYGSQLKELIFADKKSIWELSYDKRVIEHDQYGEHYHTEHVKEKIGAMNSNSQISIMIKYLLAKLEYIRDIDYSTLIVINTKKR